MNEQELYISQWAAKLPITLAIGNALADGKLDYQPWFEYDARAIAPVCPDQAFGPV